MTAIQVTTNVSCIMDLPCVSDCHKEQNGRFSFRLLDGKTANEGDWIINAEDKEKVFVISDEHCRQIRDMDTEQLISECQDPSTPSRYSREELEKIKMQSTELNADTTSSHPGLLDLKGTKDFAEEIKKCVEEKLWCSDSIDDQSYQILADRLFAVASRKMTKDIDAYEMAKDYVNSSVIVDSMNFEDVRKVMCGIRDLVFGSYLQGIEDALEKIKSYGKDV